MNLFELIARLRTQWLDDVSDAPDQSDEGYRWSKTELSGYLAEAQNEACRRGDLLYEETDDTTTLVTLAEGTYIYSINDKMLRVTDVLLDGEPLKRTTIPLLTQAVRRWRSSTNSTPRSYAIQGRTLVLYPPPDATNAALECRTAGYRLPLLPLSATNPTPEIQTALHPFLCYYAAQLAYLKRDEDTYNAGMSEKMKVMFDQHFGPLYRADSMAQLFEAGESLVVVPE